MKNLVVLIFILFATGSFAQQPIVLADDDSSGITSISTRFFDNDGLWGYINGGADLYLEYGFEQLTVLDIKAGGIDYKADLYKMISPEAAFGIYSISRFKCKESAVLTAEDCLTPYQYIAAQGEVYISVSNSTGSAEAQQTTLEIARKLLAQIESHTFAKPEVFSHELLTPHTSGLKYISGQLGMQNGFVRWESLFAGIKNYQAWISTVNHNNSICYVADVCFIDSVSKEAFLLKNNLKAINGQIQSIDNKQLRLYFMGDNHIFLIEGETPEELLNYLKFFQNQ
jgi:hypothetical protein